MRFRIVVLALALVLMSGCATSPALFSSAINGDVSVTIGDVDHLCRAHGGERGCLTRSRSGKLAIYCRDESRDALAECLAHEIRHALDPTWVH